MASDEHVIQQISFNEDASLVAVAASDGFFVFSTDPWRRVFSSEAGDVGKVSILEQTSLAALVGGGRKPAFSSRRLQILNTSTKSIILELNFVSAVLDVFLNRERLIVLLKNKIHLYSLSNLKLEESLDLNCDTEGVGALSVSSTPSLFVYPGGEHAGDILVYNASTCRLMSILRAHSSRIVSLSLNSDSSLVASASEKGTVLRVFSLKSMQVTNTFRRGMSVARVCNLSFHQSLPLLCVLSSTQTVHVFRLDAPEQSENELSVAATVARVATSVARDVVSGGERDVASVKVPVEIGAQSRISFLAPSAREPGESGVGPILFTVLSSVGIVLTYSLSYPSGDCSLLNEATF